MIQQRALFTADDLAMIADTIDAWDARMVSKNDKARYREQQRFFVTEFVRYVERVPWACTRADADAFGRYLVEGKRHRSSTVRQKQRGLRAYFAFLTDPEDEWLERLQPRPQQIFTAETIHPHTTLYEGDPDTRNLTASELDRIFDALQRTMRGTGKEARAAARDLPALSTTLSYGLRAQETAGLDIFDHKPNARLREYGEYAALDVRHGKAKRHGQPKRRSVLTTPLFAQGAHVLRYYIEHVRPEWDSIHPTALFVTERGTRITPRYLSKRFRDLVRRLDIRGVTLHSLRHTYATMLLEQNYGPAFVKEQLGHETFYTTAIYTHLSDDYRIRTIHEHADNHE